MSSRVDIKYKNGENIYFTSDTHFGHEGIINFCDRPFASIEDMDEALISNWNEKVPEDGIVFHLGDFAWGGAPKYKEYLSRLNGEIILIRGNHDMRNCPISKMQDEGMFKLAVHQLLIEIEGRKIYLNHLPFLCYGGTYRNFSTYVFQLFGHVHSGPNQKGLDIDRLSMLFPTQYDVGVDNNNYTPISWNEVNNKILSQLLNANAGKQI